MTSLLIVAACMYTNTHKHTYTDTDTRTPKCNLLSLYNVFQIYICFHDCPFDARQPIDIFFSGGNYFCYAENYLAVYITLYSVEDP